MKLSEINSIFSDSKLQELIMQDLKEMPNVTDEQVAQTATKNPDHLALFLDKLAENLNSENESIAKKLYTAIQAAIKSDLALVTLHQPRIDAIQKRFFEIQEQRFNSKEAVEYRTAALCAKALEWKCVGLALSAASKEFEVDQEFKTAKVDELFDRRMARIARHETSNPEILEWHTRSLDEAKANFDKHYQALQNLVIKIKSISSAFDTQEHDARKLVLECQQALCSAQANPAYRLLCIDEMHPLVRYIHHMAFAMVVKPKVLDAYRAFHQKEPRASTFADATRELARPIESLKLEKLFIIDYDLENPEKETNCGELYEESISPTLSLTRLISAAKVMNSNIDPILELLLQAIENRHFQPIENDLDPYDGFILTNMQQMKVEKERADCIVLMKLNERYPFSISTITISAHNPNEEESLQGPLESLSHLLTLDVNFTLEGNLGSYYFPLKYKKEWQEALPKIVTLAQGALSKLSIKSEKKREVAFYQLVKHGIIRFHELFASTKLTPKKRLLSLVVCRSGVDRAGHTNAALVWLLGGANSAADAAKVFIGRAILSHARLPNPSHMNKLINFGEVVPKTALKSFLEEIPKAFPSIFETTAS